MSDISKKLKAIMKYSGLTQEQLATRLGVSFPTVNSWINGRTRPRKKMAERVHRLYLIQETGARGQTVYISITPVPSNLRVATFVMLDKDIDNYYDDESILIHTIDDDGVVDGSEFDSPDAMFVANSVQDMARGTYSAGRIYDRVGPKTKARIDFIVGEIAIAKIVDWG